MTPSCRLFVIMASRAPIAAILRRGPSAWVQVIEWRTREDRFVPGAWFKGRIYEEKCDLSPDGELLVYACLKGSRSGSDYTHAWTAVSRLPWLHALALWPMGTTYGGGGRFEDDRRLVLRGALEAHPDHGDEGLEVVAGEAPVHASTGEVPEADWSGRDQQGSLVYTRGGELFRRVAGREHLLADFGDHLPDPTPAPEWARASLR